MPATCRPSPLINRDHRPMLLWLCVCALLVVAMVFVGGYTRLSGSGLSITEWKPIHGAIPPLNLTEWEEEFAAYRQSPQYLKVNRGMSLEEFKAIFWPEYFHRLLGRAIGIVFFLPFAIFLIRRSLSTRFSWRLAGIFALGGLQGLIGWLMVKSGLVDDPRVSHFRLALHLSVALLILGLLEWAILDVFHSLYSPASPPPQPSPATREREWYMGWFVLLCLQIILGALVAGLHGGLLYNTWPDMNGTFLPPEFLELGASQALHDPGAVQFLHRNVAILLVFGFIFWWYLCRAYVTDKALQSWCILIAVLLALQFALGVLTLLHMVPLNLALAHQMTALILLCAAIGALHQMTRYDKQAA